MKAFSFSDYQSLWRIFDLLNYNIASRIKEVDDKWCKRLINYVTKKTSALISFKMLAYQHFGVTMKSLQIARGRWSSCQKFSGYWGSKEESFITDKNIPELQLS